MENEIIVNGVTYVKKEDNQKKQSKRDNEYWFIDTNGDIHLDRDEVTEKHKPFCYPTEAEAIKARDKQLALYRIKTYAEENRGEFITDWNNDRQTKYHIAYNNRKKEYWVDSNDYVQKFNLFYLAKQEHCNEIIEKFKDDLDILFDRK